MRSVSGFFDVGSQGAPPLCAHGFEWRLSSSYAMGPPSPLQEGLRCFAYGEGAAGIHCDRVARPLLSFGGTTTAQRQRALERRRRRRKQGQLESRGGAGGVLKMGGTPPRMPPVLAAVPASASTQPSVAPLMGGRRPEPGFHSKGFWDRPHVPSWAAVGFLFWPGSPVGTFSPALIPRQQRGWVAKEPVPLRQAARGCFCQGRLI